MTTVLLAILVAVISAFSKSIFDRIFREYNPDMKKVISTSKKYLFFAVRYILPIVYLIYLYIYGEFNKSFVLMNVFMITVFFANLLVDLVNTIQTRTNAHIVTLTNITKQLAEKLYSDKTSETDNKENNL
jgi:hypothetical protein